LLEQVYQAFTILNGHPYHSGTLTSEGGFLKTPAMIVRVSTVNGRGVRSGETDLEGCERAHRDRRRNVKRWDDDDLDFARHLNRFRLMLLPRNGEVEPFFRGDDVIVDIPAQIDLHPVDLPVKYARIASVV